MRYIIEHTKLGFDWLDLLALIILLVVVIVWAVRRHNLKSEQKDLEDQLSELYAQDSIEEQKKRMERKLTDLTQIRQRDWIKEKLLR